MTDKKQTPVAKSLHTVTVLIQIASLHREINPELDRIEAMNAAMRTLGLADRPNPYALDVKALRLWLAA